MRIRIMLLYLHHKNTKPHCSVGFLLFVEVCFRLALRGSSSVAARAEEEIDGKVVDFHGFLPLGADYVEDMFEPLALLPFGVGEQIFLCAGAEIGVEAFGVRTEDVAVATDDHDIREFHALAKLLDVRVAADGVVLGVFAEHHAGILPLHDFPHSKGLAVGHTERKLVDIARAVRQHDTADSERQFAHAVDCLQVVALTYCVGRKREMRTRRISREHDVVEVGAPLRGMSAYAIRGGEDVLQLSVEVGFGQEPIARSHHDKTLFRESARIVAVEVLVAVCPTASVDVQDERQDTVPVLGTVDIERVHGIAVGKVIEDAESDSVYRRL